MKNHTATLPDLRVDPSGAPPLRDQVYDSIRAAILAGQLAANTRLPASRALARELGVSRNTVMEAYAQLLSEGYIEGKIGSGTYVAHTLPDAILQAGAASGVVAPAERRSTSRR